MELAEFVVTQHANSIVDVIATKKKMQGMTIAMIIPGLVHNHPPSSTLVDTCDFCRRSGNAFAPNETGRGVHSGDLVQKYSNKIIKILKELEAELINVVDRAINGLDDEDAELERMLMEELE